MNFRVVFTRQFAKQLAKLDSGVKQSIREAVDQVKEDPYKGKLLKGVLSGRWSYRVGAYRIIYQIHQSECVVIAIAVGHRREIYR